MIIENLKIKNFLSYGENKFHELNFLELDNATLIKGENGVGKSSIQKALLWGIYGKIEGVTLKQIGNIQYPKPEVIVELLVDKNKIYIHRTKSKLSVKINGEELDIPNKKDVQKELEKKLKVSYSVFNNYITINSINHKSILYMTPKDRKNILENILGFKELNDFSNYFGEKYKEFLDKIKTLESENSFISQNINRSKEELKSIEISKKNIVIVKTEDVEKYRRENEDLYKTIKEIEQEKLEYFNNKEKLKVKLETNKIIFKEIKGNIESLQFNKCPSCGRLFDETVGDLSTIEQKIKELENEKLGITNVLKNCDKFIKDLDLKIEKANERIDSCTKKIEKNDKIIEKEDKNNSDYLEKIKLLDIKYDTYLDIIKKDEEKIKKINSKLKKLYERKNDYEEGKFLLGDSGLKKLLLDSSINTLNKLTDKYKQYFTDLDFDFNFSPDLKLSITRGDKSFSSKSLSNGETEKADLIIILAIIEIIKIKNNFNILFIDEMFGGLSPVSEEKAISLIKIISKTLGLKSLIVTHHEYSMSEYDILRVEKIKGFSNITYNKSVI